MTQAPKPASSITITMQGDWEVTTSANALTIRFRDDIPAPIDAAPINQPQPAVTQPTTQQADDQPIINNSNRLEQITEWLKAEYVLDATDLTQHPMDDLVQEFLAYRRRLGDFNNYDQNAIRIAIGKWAARRPNVLSRRLYEGQDQNRRSYRAIMGIRRRKKPIKPGDASSNRIDFNT